MSLLYSPLGTLIIVLAVGGLVLQACVSVLGSKRTGLSDRLKAHLGEQQQSAAKARRDWRAAFGELAKETEKTFSRLSVWSRLQHLVERADPPFGAAELAYLLLGGGIVGALIGGVLGGAPAGFVLFCLGAAAPLLALRVRANRRMRAFEKQLPDLLISLASALRSGHSFKVGLQAIADQGQPPASKELGRALAEERMGRPLDEALDALSKRIGSKDLDFLLTAVSVQSQVGGSLATLCDTVADAVRERQQFTRKLRAVTATARTSARVLMVMPFALAGFVAMISPHYETPLFQSPTGRLFVIVSLVLVGIGSLVLKRMTTFKG
jgi:tight adherence protein B